MDMLTNPALAVEANSLWGFIAYFLYHLFLVIACLMALAGIVMTFLLKFYKPTPRVRIVGPDSRGAWFPLSEQRMLEDVIEEQHKLHGRPDEVMYWLEFSGHR